MKDRISYVLLLLFLLFSFLLSSSLLFAEEEERCPSCGEMVEKGSAFCYFCGAKLREDYEKKKWPNPEEILKKAQKSVFCVSALHHRYLYNAMGDKDLMTYLLGTAFLIKSGYALTDLAIIDGAREVKLIDENGKWITCQVHGKDYLYGIAVLKLEGRHLLPLELGNSDEIRIGHTVYALGYPSVKGEARVGISIGKGIVGALGRSRMGLKQYEDFIQTDVPFSDGMSGAPLLDQHGKLIGMIVMHLFSRGFFFKQAPSVGFAIPINEIITAAKNIIEGHRKSRGWLGITLNDMRNHPDKELRKIETGLFIEFIIPGSPAEKAGLHSGDMIVSLNGSEIRKIQIFQKMIFSSLPGEKIHLKIKNKKGLQSFTIPLEKRPDKIRLSSQDMIFWLSGLRFKENKKGRLIVSYVRKGSVAFNKGIQKGFRLDDIFVKKDYRSEKDDYDFFSVRSWEDFERVANRGFSDFDFLLLLRFKEKDKRGFRQKIFVYGLQQDFPSA